MVPTTSKNSRSIILAALLVAGLGIVLFFLLPQSATVETTRREISRLFLRGDFDEALAAADTFLNSNPDDDNVRLIAAKCAARLNDTETALDYLAQITQPNSEACLLEAELAVDGASDFTRAEIAFRRAISLTPDDVAAQQGLVRLLGICGRRSEALPFLCNLVRLGHGSEQLTIAARGSGSVSDPELVQRAFSNFPNDANTLVAMAVKSDRQGNLDSALKFARQANNASPHLAAAKVDLGRYLLQSQKFDEIEVWSTQLDDECLKFAETWRVKGYLAEHRGKQQDALECYLRAVTYGPELKDVHHRLSQLMIKAGDKARAAEFSARLVKLQQLEAQQDRMFQSGVRDVGVVISTVQKFRDLGRFWEALGWTQVALSGSPTSQPLRKVHGELLQETLTLSLQLVADDFNPAREIEPTDYSLPDVAPRIERADFDARAEGDSKNMVLPTGEPSFRDDALTAGVEFVYINGVSGDTTHRMFEFTGGGIAALDFDRDDYPDLFLTQGCLWDSRGRSLEPIKNHDSAWDSTSDRLLRNVHGQKFANSSDVAGFNEHMFGQGLASGDINEDGFPDIFVSNIGNNALWVNNGDGTFSDRSDLIAEAPAVETWTTSAVIADLNSDGFADIYATNYLQGDDVFDRVCRNNRGEPRACIPVHFDGVRDSLFVNDAQGKFQNKSTLLDEFAPGKSLGVAAWKSSATSQLSVLVANDTTPNMLIQFDESGAAVRDLGFESGLAVSAQGKSEGSMGIALSDTNNDGMTEVLVTNFYNETNTFYQAVDDGLFEDRTSSVNLESASMPVLGFGTQFIDANLDGRLELVVANGHVDDLRSEGKPYLMPTQVFRMINGAFKLEAASQLGSYFESDHLGRSVVCLDWNVDLRPDIAIGHLAENYALLTNTSSTPGHGVSLQLVGTRSSRDAIGATIAYRMNDRTITRQLTAGDGYHASNQHEVWLGCGIMNTIESLTVTWPSGLIQTFGPLATNHRYQLKEGFASEYRLP